MERQTAAQSIWVAYGLWETMTTRAVAQVDDWQSEPFSGGYAGLHELADDGFSGIVQCGTAKACFLNGTVVGILDGSIEDFEDATGTAFMSPSPAIPLLALMQEQSDEVRAKYYTEETPISEVDSTLSDGGFSGYIELSENVLSGDYYVVYHAGRSMSVAWVGNSGELLTDDEAFERADDEVGIYEVRPVDVEPVEIPEPERSTTAGAAGTAAGAGSETGAATDAGTTTGAAGNTTGSDEAATGATAGEGTAGDAGVDAQSTATDEAGDATATRADAGADEARADAGTDETRTDATTDETSTRATETATEESDAAADDSGGGERTTEAGAGAGESSGRESGARSRSTTETRPGDGAEGGADARTDQPRERDRSREDRQHDQPRREDEGRSRGSDERAGGGAAGTRAGDQGGAETASGTPDAAGEGDAAGRAGDVSAPGRLERRSIPSLDPARTTSEGRNGDAAVSGAAAGAAPPASDREGAAPESQRRTESAGGNDRGQTADRTSAGGRGTADGSEAGTAERRGSTDTAGANGGPAGGGAPESGRGASSQRVGDLEAELEEAEAEVRRLEAELADVEAERDDLRADLEEVRAERDDLRAQVADLREERDALAGERDELRTELDEAESELEGLRSQLRDLEDEYGAATGADRRLNPAEALEQTNLFVRYESKGEATLESAHDGNASREEVSENLGLEYHTQFEAANVSVAGKSFREFLEGTIQYRFVTWVINNLLYEIRDTGKVSALEDLYDAIPKIDRAELNGVVAVEYVEDGQDRRSQESFDIALRDRMGNALIVANLNDSRQAATENMMSSLVTAASHVGESEDSLAASFLVTSSFFEPEALETASEATSGGLLSRDKRESFVKLSRKRGYHLCLAEAREGQFHLAVPEL